MYHQHLYMFHFLQNIYAKNRFLHEQLSGYAGFQDDRPVVHNRNNRSVYLKHNPVYPLYLLRIILLALLPVHDRSSIRTESTQIQMLPEHPHKLLIHHIHGTSAVLFHLPSVPILLNRLSLL